jgi:chromatin structure-remodeling complex subunit SFH1
MFTTTGKTAPPQAFMSSYAPRLRSHGNSLMSPIVPAADDFEDSDRPRRATGLRSLQRDAATNLDQTAHIAALGQELTAPVELQGIWRDWMGRPKRTLCVQIG